MEEMVEISVEKGEECLAIALFSPTVNARINNTIYKLEQSYNFALRGLEPTHPRAFWEYGTRFRLSLSAFADFFC